MSARFVPPLVSLSPESDHLREEVRAFLDEERIAGGFVPRVDSWISGWDEDFSRRLGSHGWLGMTIPEEYGGHGLGITEATILAEEVARSGGAMNAASATTTAISHGL